jgi:F-type H+-transporting ATPase subunit gamma
MASTKEIKRRIKSVKSTRKITKAMELVAASKMKRAISQTMSSRLYAQFSWEVLTSLSERLENSTNKFFVEKSLNKILVVLITSNRGLCGGYNSQIIKKAISLLKSELALENNQGPVVVDIVAVGKKGDSAMRRIGQNVVASFTDIPENVTFGDIIPLSSFLTKEFVVGEYGKVYIAYTDFVSALLQKPRIRKILPVSRVEIKEIIEENLNIAPVEKIITKKEIPYLIEGETDKLLDILVDKLVRMQIYQMILESNASEQSARMMAMKNASEAAGEMIEDLTLAFNKERQSGITREISEISAGMASVS